MRNRQSFVLLVLVTVVGLTGLYGSSPDLCSVDEGLGCPSFGGNDPPGIRPDPPPVPAPAVSINHEGIGLAAYGEDGRVVVRRLNGTAGFSEPETVATGFEEDIDVVAAASRARIVWRGINGRISVLSGELPSGAWDTQIDLATSGADDAIFANGDHSSLARSYVLWRQADTNTAGQSVTNGYGSLTLVSPHTRLTRYAPDEDVSASEMFGLKMVASNTYAVAVWTARQRSDPSVVHVYAATSANGQWREARRIGTFSGNASPVLDIDNEGNVIVIWSQNSGLVYNYYQGRFDTWFDEPTPVPIETRGAHQLHLDMTRNGILALAWRAAEGGVWAATTDVFKTRWYAVQRLDVEGSTPLNGREPRIAVTPEGRRVVVWRNDQNAYFNEGTDDSWEPPVLLGPTQSAVDLDLNRGGVGAAVWWNDGFQSRIWEPRTGPIADFTFSPDPGVVGVGVRFDAQASRGQFPIAMYEWDWDGDGVFDATGGPIFSTSFATPGVFETQLRVTDTAGQTATTSRTVTILPLGEVSSQVHVHHSGDGAGVIEIHSTQPGFTPVRCERASSPVGGNDPGTCSATVLAGYDITIVAEYDPARSTFSGWPEGPQQCRTVVTSTAPGGTRSECRFGANTQDRTFEVLFQIAPPTTQILRIEVHPNSQGGGSIISRQALVSCTVENQLIRNATGGNCNYSVAPGTRVELLALQTPGSLFVGWEGCDVTVAPNECHVTVNGLRVVRAQFSGG